MLGLEHKSFPKGPNALNNYTSEYFTITANYGLKNWAI